MIKKVYIIIFLSLFLFTSCKEKKNGQDKTVNQNEAKIEEKQELDTEIMECIGEYNNGIYCFTVNQRSNYELPDLSSYGEFSPVSFYTVEKLNINKLNMALTDELQLVDVKLANVTLENDCPNITEIDIWDTELNRENFFEHFPNLDHIYFRNGLITVLPNFSNNKNLNSIVLNEEDYNNNINMIRKIEGEYPHIEIDYFIQCDL